MCLASALQIARCQARWQHAGPNFNNQLSAPNWVAAQVCTWWHAYSITLQHQHLHAYAPYAHLKCALPAEALWMLQAVDEARSLRLDKATSAVLRVQVHQSDSPRSHRDHSDSEAAGELEPDDEDALEPGGSAWLSCNASKKVLQLAVCAAALFACQVPCPC